MPCDTYLRKPFSYLYINAAMNKLPFDVFLVPIVSWNFGFEIIKNNFQHLLMRCNHRFWTYTMFNVIGGRTTTLEKKEELSQQLNFNDALLLNSSGCSIVLSNFVLLFHVARNSGDVVYSYNWGDGLPNR